MSEELIRQGINNLQRQNQEANAALSATLQDLRERVSAGASLPPLAPSPLAPNDFQYQRLLLTNSQFTSEVVAAAVLNEEFKTATAARAREILVEHGLLPPEANEPAEEPPPPETAEPASTDP